MPAQPGPRSDQLAQRSTTLGNVLTAGSVAAPDPLAVPSYQPSTITGRVGEGTDLGDVSGAQPVIHLIGGANISVALVEIDGELQFTITAATAQIQQSFTQLSGVVSFGPINPGFTPILAVMNGHMAGCGQSLLMGLGLAVGTGTAQQSSMSLQGGGLAGGGNNSGTIGHSINICVDTWTVTTFTSSDVSVTGVSGGRSFTGSFLILG